MEKVFSHFLEMGLTISSGYSTALFLVLQRILIFLKFILHCTCKLKQQACWQPVHDFVFPQYLGILQWVLQGEEEAASQKTVREKKYIERIVSTGLLFLSVYKNHRMLLRKKNSQKSLFIICLYSWKLSAFLRPSKCHTAESSLGGTFSFLLQMT